MKPSNGAAGANPTNPVEAVLETSTLQSGNGNEIQSLRTYTEEQVSDLLQVSLSQLRKWRMKRNRGRQQGPPFKKFGRLVRYPEEGLQAYING